MANLSDKGRGFAGVPGAGGLDVHAPRGVRVGVLADFLKVVGAQLHAGQDGAGAPFVTGQGFTQVVVVDVLSLAGLQGERYTQCARAKGPQALDCQAGFEAKAGAGFFIVGQGHLDCAARQVEGE